MDEGDFILFLIVMAFLILIIASLYYYAKSEGLSKNLEAQQKVVSMLKSQIVALKKNIEILESMVRSKFITVTKTVTRELTKIKTSFLILTKTVTVSIISTRFYTFTSVELVYTTLFSTYTSTITAITTTTSFIYSFLTTTITQYFYFTETITSYVTEEVTRTVTYNPCTTLTSFETNLNDAFMIVTTLPYKRTLWMRCYGEATLALGSSVQFYNYMENGRRIVKVAAADDIIPCGAYVVTVTEGKITIALVGQGPVTFQALIK